MSAFKPLWTFRLWNTIAVWRAGVGTIGGKIGFAVGAVVTYAVSVAMIQLVFGDCFFEQGCPNERVGLVAAAIASLFVGIVSGLLFRGAVNRLLGTRR
jgi:hypothetical protein